MGFKEQMEEMLPEMVIHTVSFDHNEGTIEVSFAELRDQAEGAGMMKAIAFERELFHEEVNSLESDLRDLIDEVIISIRNKDARKARIDRALARLKPEPEPEEEEDDE